MAEKVEITPKHIKGAIAEIVAGAVLDPKSDIDRAWNAATFRAEEILQKYIIGDGLFQVSATEHLKRAKEKFNIKSK